MERKLENPIIIRNSEGNFQLLDDAHHTLENKSAKRGLAIFAPYFENAEQRILKKELTYVQLQRLLKKINHRLSRKGLPEIQTSDQFDKFIEEKQYFIKEQSQAGLTIKDDDNRWDKEFKEFHAIVNQEITRPLKPKQEKASFFLTVMKRAANFSVPGAGKTAMTYGAFAYLSSKQVDEVDKILVICPLNAFAAWRTEFSEVFGPKRKLSYMNLRDSKYRDNIVATMHDWNQANVITINYESLQSKLNLINDLLDAKTMLVFDEVHRIKSVRGQRAQAALSLSQAPHYRYVLTGTPIPNGFQDIYNFLHLMYPNEYTSFFTWDLNSLKNIDPADVNKKLAPFFWRTNKQDLNVPKADPDILETVTPTESQKKLAEIIYSREKGALARFTRLLQASTNPELLKFNINYRDLGLLDSDSSEWSQEFSKIAKENESGAEKYQDLDLAGSDTPKFERGIALVEDLVSQGKKVLVWGIFVGTMHKITDRLNDLGIKTSLIYGSTPKGKREGMIDEFRTGDVQVLVSNPNTLGESISLHQTVHDAVYFEYNFNLTFMLQSRDRIHRLGIPAGQYTRYYYLMTQGDVAHSGYIDQTVYNKLKDKEQVMLDAIEGKMLVPEYTDDYLKEVKSIILGKYK